MRHYSDIQRVCEDSDRVIAGWLQSWWDGTEYRWLCRVKITWYPPPLSDTACLYTFYSYSKTPVVTVWLQCTLSHNDASWPWLLAYPGPAIKLSKLASEKVYSWRLTITKHHLNNVLRRQAWPEAGCSAAGLYSENNLIDTKWPEFFNLFARCAVAVVIELQKPQVDFVQLSLASPRSLASGWWWLCANM